MPESSSICAWTTVLEEFAIDGTLVYMHVSGMSVRNGPRRCGCKLLARAPRREEDWKGREHVRSSYRNFEVFARAALPSPITTERFETAHAYHATRNIAPNHMVTSHASPPHRTPCSYTTAEAGVAKSIRCVRSGTKEIFPRHTAKGCILCLLACVRLPCAKPLFAARSHSYSFTVACSCSYLKLSCHLVNTS